MRYDILLLDADETLMDFPAAERQALQRTFADQMKRIRTELRKVRGY